jgi:L-ribulose-5-phosphate 3-epimerase
MKWSISTCCYDGYPLQTALEQISSLGFSRVEIAAVTGWTEHVVPEKMNLAEFKKVHQLLAANSLSAPSFSGHVDLGTADSVPLFKRRIEFAEFIGSSIVNTFTTHPSKKDAFLRNIEILSAFAAKRNIRLALETHGDLVDSGRSGALLVKELARQNIGLNYDPANVVFFKGNVDIGNDIRLVGEKLMHLHMKDVKIDSDGSVCFPCLGEGDVDFPKLLGAMQGMSYDGPVSLEIELTLHGSRDELVLGDRLPIEQINARVQRSVAFIEKINSEQRKR